MPLLGNVLKIDGGGSIGLAGGGACFFQTANGAGNGTPNPTTQSIEFDVMLDKVISDFKGQASIDIQHGFDIRTPTTSNKSTAAVKT